MSISINEAVVVITRSSSGSGKAAGMALASEGATLALRAHRELEQTAAEWHSAGTRLETTVLDVCEEAVAWARQLATLLRPTGQTNTPEHRRTGA